MAVSMDPKAVIMITVVSGACFLKNRSTSIPSLSPIRTSVMMMSKRLVHPSSNGFFAAQGRGDLIAFFGKHFF